MKKVLKKSSRVLFLILLVVSIFNIFNVLAEEVVFKITNIEIKDKSIGVDASIVDYDNDNVKTNITYHNLNDYVVFDVTLKNNSSKKYTIKEISDNNTSYNLEYVYDKHENDVFNSNEEKSLQIKTIYKNENNNINKRTINNSVKFTISLIDENGNETSKTILINPKTGDNILIYVILGIISLTGLVITTINKKQVQKRLMVLVLSSIVVIPLGVKAANINFALTFNENIKLYDKLLVTINGEEKEIEYNTTIDEPQVPSKDGYDFIGWFNGDEEFDFDTPITEDIILEPKYNVHTYSISYDYNEGIATNPNEYTIEDKITLNNPTKEGYTFIGWTESNIETPQINVTIEKGTTGNKNFVAHFEANELNFNGNETISKVYSDESQEVTINEASNGTGNYTYTITEGNTNNYFSLDGTTLTIKENTPVAVYTLKIKAKDNNSNVSKEAIFKVTITKKKSNTVTNLNVTPEGIVSFTNSSNADGYFISIDGINYTPVAAGKETTDYDYLNEIIAEKGTRTVYVKSTNSDSNNYSESDPVSVNVTVYSLSISVNDNTLGTVSQEELNVISGATYTTNENKLTLSDGREVTTSKKSITGYTITFDGWSEESGTISQDTAVFANYSKEKIKYTVTFNTDGGTTIPSQEVAYQEKVTRPETDPEKDYYEFVDWYSDSSKSVLFDFENTVITGQRTIYAEYRSISHCEEFESDSWDTIVSKLKTNNKYYKPGCTKNIEMDMNDDGTNETYAIRLINTGTSEKCSTEGFSQTTCGTVVEFTHVFDSRRMRETVNSNSGGWQNTDLVLYLNSEFYDKLPSDLKSVIIPTYPIVSGSGMGYQSPNITQSDSNKNKLYLPTIVEVGYTNKTFDNAEDYTKTYEYYSKYEGRVKKSKEYTAYWLRTASADDTKRFLNITGSGNLNVNVTATSNLGYSPVFRIGEDAETYTVTFDTDGGTAIPSQNVIYRGKVTRPETIPEKELYTLDGWYTDDSYSKLFDFTNTIITKDTTIYAKYKKKDNCDKFAVDSWSTIENNIKNIPDYYAVGCEKEVELDMDDDNTPESYTVRLANTSTPEECSVDGYSQTACGTVIEFVDIVGNHIMNTERTNVGGWRETEMVTYLNSDFYNKLPSDLQSLIIPTYPIVSGSGSGVSGSINITEDDIGKNKIYLLSAREVGFDSSYDNKKDVTTDTRVLDCYVAQKGRTYKIKKDLSGSPTLWWLRTAGSSFSYAFHYVLEDGSCIRGSADIELGVAPAFRIGTTPKNTVTFDTDGGSDVPSQTVIYGKKVTKPATDPTKEGFVFAGWYTDDSYKTKFDFSKPITKETTIYAHFEELKVCANNENITRLSENTCSNNENITIGNGIVCKRAVKLHEETCSQTDGTYYCSGAGYTESGSKGTSTITYGSCGTSGTLTSGDAFTCDVNGDEKFDELTERFYYVSDYYDTSAKEFDDSTAILIYYNNVTSGVSCNKNTFAYDSSKENWHGPRTLVSQLPTTSQWSNVSLKSEKRAILAEDQSTHNFPTTTGGTLPTDFSYEGYAARFLTAKELMAGCNLIEVGRRTTGELDSCNYIMENTKYAKSTIGSTGTWLETPNKVDFYSVWYASSYYISVRSSSTNNANFGGARPAIEVPKSKISY